MPASSEDSSRTSDHNLPSCLETFAVSSLDFVISCSCRGFVVVLSSLSLVDVVVVISTLPSGVVAVAVAARA